MVRLIPRCNILSTYPPCINDPLLRLTGPLRDTVDRTESGEPASQQRDSQDSWKNNHQGFTSYPRTPPAVMSATAIPSWGWRFRFREC
jgi:hypothetical protein